MYWAWVMYQVGPCNWMMVGEWCLATNRFWVSQIWGFTWTAGKGDNMLEPVGWVARRKRRGAAGELEVRQMEEAKEIEVPTLARRSLPGKGMVQVGTTRKK